MTRTQKTVFILVAVVALILGLTVNKVLNGRNEANPAELIDAGIRLNAVNPGPVNTGYLDPETTDRPDRLDEIKAAFPLGRFGEPDDPARLIEFLVTQAGGWIVGQVIDSEGGFRRG